MKAAFAAIDDLRGGRKPPHYWAAIQAAGEALTSPTITPRLLKAAVRKGPDRWHLAIAENPNCPPVVLDEIVCDSVDHQARLVALKHRRCPRSTLAYAARRAARDRRAPSQGECAAAVAGNPNSPPRALRRVAGMNEWVRSHLAANPAVSERMLVDLAEAEDSRVRSGVARNPAAPPRVLAGLASDDLPVVRAAVAANPSTPAGSLQALAVDSSPVVRAAAAGNPSTPAAGRAAGGLLAD